MRRLASSNGGDYFLPICNDQTKLHPRPDKLSNFPPSVTSNVDSIPNNSSLVRQRASDGDWRIKHDVDLNRRYFELGTGIIPEDLSEPHAKEFAVKTFCLTNGYQPMDSSQLSDKTECLQFNFESFHSITSRRQMDVISK
ncbi:hypothetical protein GJ496_011539 [Pomphorhynchus laevis]|nr:hypothetical protein GJ496_011539 [Pomphorhynchus laevis]